MRSTDGARATRIAALKFGGGALLLLGAFGALLAIRKHHVAAGSSIAAVGGTLFLLALASPSAALAVRAAWMRFAAVLGWVNTRIILGALFFVVLTPIALLRRLGGDPLDARFRRDGAQSHWRERERRDPRHYEHPY
jgi:hypothetical protein